MGRSARGHAAVALGAGAVLLALTWRTSPVPSPPMYEGQIGPAEDYRYLHPPPGLSTRDHPASATATLAVESNGHSPPLSLQTTEKPPQAQLLAAEDSFAVPAGITSVTARIAPVDPPAAPPIGGTLDGNVYAYTVTGGGRPVPVRPGHTVTVVLRSPAGVANPAMERYDGTAWTKLQAFSLGSLAGDAWEADAAALGDIALVAAPGTSSAGGGIDPFVVVLAAGAVALTIGTLVALRVRGRRPPPPPARPARKRRPPPPPPRRRR